MRVEFEIFRSAAHLYRGGIRATAVSRDAFRADVCFTAEHGESELGEICLMTDHPKERCRFLHLDF